MNRSRLAVPLVLGMLSGYAGLIGCQSGQPQPNDGPSGSGLMPPSPAANRSGDWLTPPRAMAQPLPQPLPLNAGESANLVPPPPAA